MEADLGTGKPDAVQLAQATRHVTRHGPQMLFTHHKVHRQIALARLTQTPVGQQLQTGQLAGAQLPGVADVAPRLFRIGALLTTQLRHPALIQGGRQPAGGFGLFHQLTGDRQQVEHIRRRVVELAFRQRARQPVGAGLALVDRQPGVLFHHGGKAPGQRTTGKGGEDLGVDQRLRHDAEGIEENFQIFTAGMQIFGDGGIQQQLAHRRPVGDPQRVDKRHIFSVIHLDQTQLRVIGAGTHKLGIQRNGGCVTGDIAQRSQLVVGGDHLVIQIIFSLVCAHKKTPAWPASLGD